MRIFSVLILFSLFFLNQVTFSQTDKKVNNNIIYLSPVPQSKMNSPFTNIIIRSNNKLNKQTVDKSKVIVTGSISGLHSGNTVVSDDDQTIVFNSDHIFSAGEIVQVYLQSGIENMQGNQLGEIDFTFSISKKDLNSKLKSNPMLQNILNDSYIKHKTAANLNTSSIKKLNRTNLNLPADFPQIIISTSLNPSPGYIFISNFNAGGIAGTGSQGQPYLLILDNSGKPFYYKRMENMCLDFKLQPNGLLTYYDATYNSFFAMNNNFEIINSYQCSQGYWTDLHELQILPNGHYLIIADDVEQVDMSETVAGGDTSATVIGIIIQEIDENKNVVFQWRSWDHYKITDATDDINLTSTNIDYVHTNAIELDNDGNIIISNRHMDEITKINRQTGDIIWRLGGKNNQFQFLNDNVGFSHQHDIRRLPNGDLTLFDDGNLHWSQLPSRAVEYNISEQNLTAELVWEFINTPDEISSAMGNMQRLNNGNTIIGWGTGNPAVTEVTMQGQKEYELYLPDGMFNYRAFKFALDTTYYKSFVPTLISPSNNSQVTDSKVELKWDKNKFAQSFHVQLATDSAFEHVIYEDSSLVKNYVEIDSLEEDNIYYWRVLSDNNTDSLGGYSGYTKPFSFSTLLNNPTNLNVYTTSQANFLVWGNLSGKLDSTVVERKGGNDTVNYKIVGYVPKNKSYFTDNAPDKINVVSNRYTYRIKATKNNISSDYIYSQAIEWNTPIYSGKGYIPKTYSLKHNYPNPFNPTTYIIYDLPIDGWVVIKVYDILGKEIETLVNKYQNAGEYEVIFKADNLSSGIYLYRLTSGNFSQTKKMILEK
jgi:Arylsulfotransferase (ASST)/Secretion system C-terminal sorting domain